jgi:hypothetical protein
LTPTILALAVPPGLPDSVRINSSRQRKWQRKESSQREQSKDSLVVHFHAPLRSASCGGDPGSPSVGARSPPSRFRCVAGLFRRSGRVFQRPHAADRRSVHPMFRSSFRQTAGRCPRIVPRSSRSPAAVNAPRKSALVHLSDILILALRIVCTPAHLRILEALRPNLPILSERYRC